MRTFPKSLAAFRMIVKDRGDQLRGLIFDRLKGLTAEPVEHFVFDSRQSTIGIFVRSKLDGSLQVVVQGFMKARIFPGKHVALDGFYKHPDGTVTSIPHEEFYEFD